MNVGEFGDWKWIMECDTHHLGDFVDVEDKLEDGIELLELGGFLPGLWACFERILHGHRVLSVLGGCGLLGVTR